MLLIEKEINIPFETKGLPLLEYFRHNVRKQISSNDIPIRFAITKSDSNIYTCELGILRNIDNSPIPQCDSIFKYSPRAVDNTNAFNALLLIPTGIGADIGGHAGDGGSVARLIAAACDTLITHPNVVNASDINELPENGLYVEGSILTKLIMGTIGLHKVRSNRVAVIVNKHDDRNIYMDTINTVNAARATWGMDCPFVKELESQLSMKALYSSSGRAVGEVKGLYELYQFLKDKRSEYDAVAISSVIDVPDKYCDDYFVSHGEIVNPWGGVEAMLTHAISILLNIPTAHAPMIQNNEAANKHYGIVDPRMAAEAVSVTYLHCVLKGLHRSPHIIQNPASNMSSDILSAKDISCVIIPDGCIGLPTLSAIEQKIPVIAVRENSNRMKNDLDQLPFSHNKLFIVDNYLEAVGVIASLKAGVTTSSVRRPLGQMQIITNS